MSVRFVSTDEDNHPHIGLEVGQRLIVNRLIGKSNMAVYAVAKVTWKKVNRLLVYERMVDGMEFALKVHERVVSMHTISLNVEFITQ